MQHDIDQEQISYASMAIKSISEKSGKPADDGRFFSGMLNANTVDWEDEVYDPKGINYKSFKACGGPILVRHFGETTPEGYSCVVARALSMSAREDGFYIHKAEFDVDALSEHYRGKVQRGFITAMSAGLRRLECEYQTKGGKEVRVVTKSMLVHGVLTSQPVNRDSLIGRKSLDRIEALSREMDGLGRELNGLKSQAIPLERFEELAEAIKAAFAASSMGIRPGVHPTAAIQPMIEPEEKMRLDQLVESFTAMANTARRAAGA